MIYVVAHKQYLAPHLDDGYKTIYVGDKIREFAEKRKFLTDSNKEYNQDNISEKNASYCELTALYWIWKNDNVSFYIGLNHYRRYFLSANRGGVVTSQEINKIMQNSDVILPMPIELKWPVYQYYCRAAGYEKDLLLMKEIIKRLYPDYLSVCENFLQSKKMSCCNMFVMRQEDFQAYSFWIFTILFEIEKKLDISEYNLSEKRVYGYLGELLLNVWVMKNEKKVSYLNIINTDKVNGADNKKHKISIKTAIKNIVRSIVYFPSGIPYRRRLK